jgi:hypothetical protein
MKIIPTTLISVLAAASTTSAHSLAYSVGKQIWDLDLKVAFNTDQDIEDSPESLTIMEQCMIMSCNEAHGTDYQLFSASVKSSGHKHHQTRADILNHLRGAVSGAVSVTRRGDDDDDYWYNKAINWYNFGAGGGCSSCYDGTILSAPKDHKDDIAAHAKWEEALCTCLGQTDIYSGATGCKIGFGDKKDE